MSAEYHAACTGKHKYETPQDAEKQVRRVSARRKRNVKTRGPANSYKCAHCGYWHVGSTNKLKK